MVKLMLLEAGSEAADLSVKSFKVKRFHCKPSPREEFGLTVMERKIHNYTIIIEQILKAENFAFVYFVT